MKKAPAKKTQVKIEGRDPTSQLYRAVNRYVESVGGSIVVIGGVSIEWEDPGLRFYIRVKCTGRRPVLKAG